MEKQKNIPRFQLIDGGNHPREELQTKCGDERVTCRVCESHEGIDTTEFLTAGTMVMKSGKEFKQVITRLLCLNCLLKGRKTYLNG